MTDGRTCSVALTPSPDEAHPATATQTAGKIALSLKKVWTLSRVIFRFRLLFGKPPAFLRTDKSPALASMTDHTVTSRLEFHEDCIKIS